MFFQKVFTLIPDVITIGNVSVEIYLRIYGIRCISCFWEKEWNQILGE